jgi:biopolymer transport protein TolR
MGMLAGGPQRAEINVTPMIDIMLVLIITFMIVTLQGSRGLDALVPQPAGPETRQPAVSRQIVITVTGHGTVEMNEEQVDVAALENRLTQLVKNVAIDVVFIRGGPDLEFQQIAQVIDIARTAGLNRVALMTR